MRTVSQFTRVILCLTLIVFVGAGCQATNGRLNNNIGMKHYKRGNYAAARQDFARAVANDPYHPDYRHNLAMAIQRQGDPASAERILRHNLSIDPMHQPTYHALAQNLIQQGRQGEAQDLLVGWVDTQPYVTESHIEMAWMHRETGNHVAAEQELRQALRIEPNNPMALGQLGQLLQETGRSDQASAYYQRSLISRWDQPEVHSRMAATSGRRDRRRSAMAFNSEMDQPAMMAQNPTVFGQPMMVSNSTMLTPDPLGLATNEATTMSRREARRERRHGGEHVAAYPLPNYGSDMAMAAPTETVMTSPSMVFQQPVIANQQFASPTPMDAGQIVIPQATTAISPTFDAPTVASGPVLMPQPDPSQAAGVVAGLPVVDPY